MEYPPPLLWEQRGRAVFPLPGGSESYFETLAEYIHRIEDTKPKRAEFEQWIEQRYEIGSRFSRDGVNFLARARLGLLDAQPEKVEATREGSYWFKHRDNGYLIALLHSRVRLIGELLELLREPRTLRELLEQANERYQMGFRVVAQIYHRMSWLRSAGAVQQAEGGGWVLTNSGASVLGSLELQGALPPRPPPPPIIILPRPDSLEAEQVVQRLIESSKQTKQYQHLEQSVRDAFDFLGFESTLLGGPGRTDVLLVANLGDDDGYRVVVDCKTTSGENVPEGQIKFPALTDHKKQYKADHIAVVGPGFRGERLVEWATEFGVALLSVETLGALVTQHARAPLDLFSYRTLFAPGLEVRTHNLIRMGEDVRRAMYFAAATINVAQALQGEEGPLSVEALYWKHREPPEEFSAPTRAEVKEAAEALSSSAIGALHRSGDGYKSPGSLATAARRLRLLADIIESGQDGSQ